MTAAKELHDRIDRLSEEGLQELQAFLEKQDYVERQMAALRAFAEGWTEEEEQAFLEGTRRRPWRTASLEETSEC